MTYLPVVERACHCMLDQLVKRFLEFTIIRELLSNLRYCKARRQRLKFFMEFDHVDYCFETKNSRAKDSTNPYEIQKTS